MSEPFRVGYVLKQYPRLSETFVLSEILGLEEAGVEVSVHSLRHATEGRFHPGIAAVKAAVSYPSTGDRASFVQAIRALPGLRSERLPEVLDFVDRLPGDRGARLLLDAIEVADRVRAAGTDHLHAHFLTVAAHTAHIVHLLTGVPYSVTAHAKDIYRHTVDWEVAARVAASATAVVTVCDANLRFLAHRLDGTEVRLVRVYNGLGPQDPPSLPAERQPGLVLGVGRLVEKKGFDLLLDAMVRLAASHPEAVAVIIGDGDQRDELMALRDELGLASRVCFLGPQPQHEVARWMRRAEVLVAPCRVGTDGNQDALPTVLLEALGAGLPVVSTPVAGIPEIVRHGREGLLVPEDDADGVSSAIAALLDDTARWREMSAAGPVRLGERFDRRTTIPQLLDAMRVPERVA